MPDRLPSTPPSQDPSLPDRSPQDPPEDREAQGARDADNPFAPPPEGSPDRPWQPRLPANGSDNGGGDGSGNGEGGDGDRGGNRGRWSSKQPRRSPGGFGQRPGDQQEGPGGPGGGPGGPGGLRWDPTDPIQRRARYALLSGMWAFFFALFNWPYVGLLLGSLALYWGISSLRAKPATPDPDKPRDPNQARHLKTAAVSGIVTSSLALAMVAATFTAQIVYRDYFTCVNDSLTQSAKESCEELLPEPLRPFLGTQEEEE